MKIYKFEDGYAENDVGEWDTECWNISEVSLDEDLEKARLENEPKKEAKYMKITKINKESIEFDNGTFMCSYHESDCCEYHWAEFRVLGSYNLNPKTGKTISIFELDFPENIEDSIQLIEGEGFNLAASDGSKYFVPCYGENNGYYSTNLALRITKPDGGKENVNLTECQKIEWY